MYVCLKKQGTREEKKAQENIDDGASGTIMK